MILKENFFTFHQQLNELIQQHMMEYETIYTAYKNNKDKYILELKKASNKYFELLNQLIAEYKNLEIDSNFKYINPFESLNRNYFLENESNKMEAFYFFTLKKYTNEITNTEYTVNLLNIKKILKDIAKSEEILFIDQFNTLVLINSFHNYRFLFRILDEYQLSLGDRSANELILTLKDLQNIKNNKVITSFHKLLIAKKNHDFYKEIFSMIESLTALFEDICIEDFFMLSMLSRQEKIEKFYFQSMYKFVHLKKELPQTLFNNKKHRILFPLICELKPTKYPHSRDSEKFKASKYATYEDYIVDYMKMVVQGK